MGQLLASGSRHERILIDEDFHVRHATECDGGIVSGPSAGVSLEGSKEFVLLCIVPKTWRGDWCTVTCSARAHKKTVVASTSVISGIEQAHLGLYLIGNQEGSALADELTQVQLAHDSLLSKQLAREATQATEAPHVTSNWQHVKVPSSEWLKRVVKIKSSSKESALESTKIKLLDLEDRLTQLSGHTESNH